MLVISLCLDPGNFIVVLLDIFISLLGHQVSYLTACDISRETGFLHVSTHAGAAHIMWFSQDLNIVVYEWQ